MKIAKYIKSEPAHATGPIGEQTLASWLPMINKAHGKEFRFVEVVECGDLPQAKEVLEKENMVLRYAIFESID